MLSVGRSCEKVCFELGVRVADGESGESSQDNDLLDSLCVRREVLRSDAVPDVERQLTVVYII